MNTSEFAERASHARRRVGLTTSQAAELIGCSRPLLAQWESGRSKSLGGRFLLKAAKAYKVDPAWLAEMTDEDGFPWDAGARGGQRSVRAVSAVSDEVSPVSEIETVRGHYRVEQLDARGAMGDAAENEDFPEIIRTIDFADSYIRHLIGFVPAPGRLKLVTGVGDSMIPRIQPGEVVLVDTGCKQYEGDGIYLINLGGGHQLKVLQDRGNAIYVVSANAAVYPAFPIAEGAIIGGRAYLIGKLERVA